MPRYRVLAKTGRNRREWYGDYTAKTAKEATKKAKAEDAKIIAKGKKHGTHIPRSTSFKAVPKKPRRRRSSWSLF